MTETGAYTWPTRDTWARHHRTTYADDIDKVTATVSSDPSDYGTTAEITQAAAELGDLWRQLGRDVREANRAALNVFPLHGSRVRRRASITAFLKARDALSTADKAVVEQAEALKHHRKLVKAAVDQLVGAAGRARLELWTVDNAERWMPANACPTWRAIVARWKEARAQVDIDYMHQVQQRPVDDQAWRHELDRRAQIELARARGHLGGAQ